MQCANLIMQGDELIVPISVKINKQLIDMNDIEAIQFTIGEITRVYRKDGSGEVSYDAENQKFNFPLTQYETFSFEGPQECQIRIKFTNGQIRGKKVGRIDLQYSLTKAEF